jgi:dUTP pyrophosphatase
MAFRIDLPMMAFHLSFPAYYVADCPPYNDPPIFGSKEAACFDLQSCEEVEIESMKTALVHTGLHLQIPKGYEVQIRSRSGLALKYNVFCLNSPGTIDSDYTGEIGVVLTNLGENRFTVRKGDRIAQARYAKLIIDPEGRIEFIKIDDLEKTERGNNGFGSTGGIANESV